MSVRVLVAGVSRERPPSRRRVPASTSRPSTRSPISISIRRFARCRSRAISHRASARRQPRGRRGRRVRRRRLSHHSFENHAERGRARSHAVAAVGQRAVCRCARCATRPARSRRCVDTASPRPPCASVRARAGRVVGRSRSRPGAGIGVRRWRGGARLPRGALSAAVRGRDRLARSSSSRLGGARCRSACPRQLVGDTRFGAAGFRVLRQHPRAAWRSAVRAGRSRAAARLRDRGARRTRVRPRRRQRHRLHRSRRRCASRSK